MVVTVSNRFIYLSDFLIYNDHVLCEEELSRIADAPSRFCQRVSAKTATTVRLLKENMVVQPLVMQ